MHVVVKLRVCVQITPPLGYFGLQFGKGLNGRHRWATKCRLLTISIALWATDGKQYRFEAATNPYRNKAGELSLPSYSRNALQLALGLLN